MFCDWLGCSDLFSALLEFHRHNFSVFAEWQVDSCATALALIHASITSFVGSSQLGRIRSFWSGREVGPTFAGQSRDELQARFCIWLLINQSKAA
jgi:hypothetical protein